MKSWILSVGDEVLSGKTINTNFSTISSYFNQIGVDVVKGITIGDDRNDIIDITNSFMNSNVDLMITTGGLGPTHDDFTKEVMKEYNVSKEDAANLVSSLDSINGSLIWACFVDQMKEANPECMDTLERPENEIRVRLRSRFVSINQVGAKYRGGGHLQAAGATIYSHEEMNNMLEELDALLKEYKEEHKEAF